MYKTAAQEVYNYWRTGMEKEAISRAAVGNAVNSALGGFRRMFGRSPQQTRALGGLRGTLAPSTRSLSRRPALGMGPVKSRVQDISYNPIRNPMSAKEISYNKNMKRIWESPGVNKSWTEMSRAALAKPRLPQGAINWDANMKRIWDNPEMQSRWADMLRRLR